MSIRPDEQVLVRLDHLERRVRDTRRLAVVLAGALGIAVLGAATTDGDAPTVDHMRTRQLDLIDAGGEVVGTLRAFPGGSEIVLEGAGGRRAVVLKAGSAESSLWMQQGDAVASMSTTYRKASRTTSAAERATLTLGGGDSGKDLEVTYDETFGITYVNLGDTENDRGFGVLYEHEPARTSMMVKNPPPAEPFSVP